MAQLDVRSDGSENVRYDYKDYYAYIRRDWLSVFGNFAAESHWHNDLEFMYITSGSLDYNVNGEIVHMEEGNGIFINARQLHYGFSAEKKDCQYICVLLHPMLLCTTAEMEQSLIRPLLDHSRLPYLLLEKTVSWQKEILMAIEEIYNHKDSPLASLYIQNCFTRIWILLLENLKTDTFTAEEKISDTHLNTLKQMLHFIHEHYDEKVSLAAIAQAGNVSKNTCLNIFNNYIKNTPINYLIGYRLKQACVLLRDSRQSISEIAFAVGFQGVSYFTETFRKYYGCSPSAYRKNTSKSF